MSNDDFFACLGLVIAGFFIFIMGIIFVSVNHLGSLIAFVIGGVAFVVGLLKMPS